MQAVTETGTMIESNGQWGKTRFAFPKHKLGVVVKDGTVRVLQQNTELCAGMIGAPIRGAVFVEQPRVIVVWSWNSGAEDGCSTGKASYVDLIRPC